MKDVTSKLLFGSIIVTLLLLLYAGLLIYTLHLAITATENPVTLKPEIGRTLASVGGLVSALVIAELAVTPPKESPGVRHLVPLDDTPPTEDAKWWVKVLTWSYIGTWIALGSAAFVIGELVFPGKVASLTTYGQAWLGLAVAAGYSYFGIQPSSDS